MKSKLSIIFGWLTILTIAVVVFNLPAKKIERDPNKPVGALGVKLIEDYLPYAKYNDGIFSNLSMYVTGSSTFAGLFNIGTNLSVGGNLTVNATTSLAQSVDEALFIGGTHTIAATGTVVTLDTNTTGPKYCTTDSFFYMKNNGSFAPSLVVSMGTTTVASGASKNLIASTTVATSSTTVVPTLASPFIYDNDERLTIEFGDYSVGSTASGTNFGNWQVEAGVFCKDLQLTI